jgi:hypothetical protein
VVKRKFYTVTDETSSINCPASETDLAQNRKCACETLGEDVARSIITYDMILLKIKLRKVIKVLMTLNIINQTVGSLCVVHVMCCMSFQVHPTTGEHKEPDCVS